MSNEINAASAPVHPLVELTNSEAIAESHSRDSERTICRFCGRRQADQIDCDLFDSLTDSCGGERPDLCWDVSFDEACKAFQELHSVIDMLRADGASPADILASVERALLPNASDHRADAQGESK